MKTKLISLAAALTFAAAAVSVPTTADARGGRVAAGIIGGLALGAIVGGAIARPYYYDYPAYPAYSYGPGYYGPACYWRRVWTPYGWRATRVCY